jgi:hypothetical protein
LSRKFRVVGGRDSAGAKANQPSSASPSIFDDLKKLRAELARADYATTGATHRPRRRSRAKDTFAPMPHRAIELYPQLGGAAWAVLIELDRMILAQRNKNPVLFWSPQLKAAGMSRTAKNAALRKLEAAGVIKIKWRGPGLAPLVWHLGYPETDG